MSISESTITLTRITQGVLWVVDPGTKAKVQLSTWLARPNDAPTARAMWHKLEIRHYSIFDEHREI